MIRKLWQVSVISLGLLVCSIPFAIGQDTAVVKLQDMLLHFLQTPKVLSAGWSTDGKWASLTPVYTGGRGGIAVRFVILDAIEDTVLFNQLLWSDEVEAKNEGSDALLEVMLEHPTWLEFVKLFKQFKLVATPEGQQEINDFPLQYQGATINANVDILSAVEAGFFNGKTIGYRIVATSSLRGNKVLSSGETTEAYDILIDGYSLSPFEARIVVVFSIYRAGFEAETARFFSFSGCRLTSGFVK